MQKYDVVVIGGGPGGYVAAIRCAQLGLRTACVDAGLGPDKKPVLGGTCLNVGCIPSKALLDSSHQFERTKEHSDVHGISTGEVKIDAPKMLARKDKIVATLTQGIAGLLKKNKIEWIAGFGSLAGAGKVTVTPHTGAATTIEATHIIIATGSVPMAIPSAVVDQKLICDSTGALSFDQVPARLGIIGAGVIGLELGSVWRRLGSQVTVLEAMDSFLGAADIDISKEAHKCLKAQGLDIQLGAKVTSAVTSGKSVKVSYELKGKVENITVDRLIVAVGRVPNTKGLGAEKASLKMDARGFVEVDARFKTNLDKVYAIGDVVRGPMLAHRASEDGVALAEMIAGQHPVVDHNLIPWVIYTWPEIAWVGKTEQQLKTEGRKYRVGKFPFAASGRARAMDEKDGLVKLIADAETDELLGGHICGPNASELVSEIVLAMSFGACAEDIALTIHGHPTLAESVHEAALAVAGRTIHI